MEAVWTKKAWFNTSLAFLVACTLVFFGAAGSFAYAEDGTTPTLKKIEASSKSLKLKTGATQQLAIMATYADKTSKNVTSEVSWSTSNEQVAKVESGLVTAVASGKAKIYASYQGKTVTIQTEVDQISKITADKKKLSLRLGELEQVKATAVFSDKSTSDITTTAEWTTDNSQIVTVDKGAVTAVGSGKTKITVKVGSKKLTIPVEVDLVSKLELTPKKVYLRPEGTQQLTLKAVFSDKSSTDVTAKAIWSSDNSSVATVDSNGLLTAKGSGKAKITATYGGKKVTIQVESQVISKLTINPSKLSLKVGETGKLSVTATYSDKTTAVLTDKAEWLSTDKEIVTVEGGVVTAVKAGKTSVVAVYGGKMVKVNVEVK